MTPRKNRVLLALGLLSLIALSACVTTRQQMNEERGIGSENSNGGASSSTPQQNTVQSEDLTPKAAEPAPAPVTQGPPATAPAPGQAPAPVAPGPQPVAPAAGGAYSIEEIRAEMARLGGKIEELEHEKKLREETRAQEQQKLQEKIAQLEKQLQEAPPAPKGPAIPEGKSPFEAGKDAYFNERYEEAIAFLDQTLASKDSGKQAEEAYYIQGESYFKLKNYQKAIVDYSKFPERFPKSQYHSKALLRIAECFDAMGMKEDAKAFYQNLVDQFPKTAEGKLAKKRLATPAKKK